MSAAKKLQNGTVNKNLITQALSPAFLEKMELSAFVSRRVKQRVMDELNEDKTLAGLTPQRAVKYVRSTFNRILSEIETPVAVISDEDTVVKICLEAANDFVAQNITQSKKHVPYHYDQEFLASMPSVATANVLEAFRKDCKRNLVNRRYTTAAKIKNTFITTLKNLHIDFVKRHTAVMRGSGREVLGTADCAGTLEFGISETEKMMSNIHREQLIGLLEEAKNQMVSDRDKKRIQLLMFIVLGMDQKDAAKAVGILMREVEYELEAAVSIVKKFDLLVEAFEDFKSITENEYEESLTSASNHVMKPAQSPSAPEKKPEPCFTFKPSGDKFNGTVTFWKGEEAIVLNCINQPSISAAKSTLQNLMKGAE